MNLIDVKYNEGHIGGKLMDSMGTVFILPPEEDRLREIKSGNAIMRTCPCGQTFKAYRKFQIYCCDTHRVQFTKGQRTYYKKSQIVEKTCKQCGKAFTTNNKKKVYCNTDCYIEHEAGRIKEGTTRVCAQCGHVFVSTHAAKIYCTAACRKEHRHANS